jgi:hypothetical protein
MAEVFRPNEISLFGNPYPSLGPILPQNVGQFIERQIFGDVTKDAERIHSNWGISDQRGGIGIKNMDENLDADRCWFSTCWLNEKGHLLLPPLVTATTNPTSADLTTLLEYSNGMYASFGTSLRLWAEATTAWGSELKSLVSAPTDVIVHKNKLYHACDTDFHRFDGTTHTNGATLGTAQKCKYFEEWDGKLFALDNDGQLDYSVDEGVTWVTSAKSDLPTGSFTSLFKYRNLAGDMIIYMGTKVGLFALNFDFAKWEETELSMPFHDFAGAGAEKWFDAAFIPNGAALRKYITSNPASANPVGPDLDDGLPDSYLGDIIQIIPGHNEFFLLMDATSTVARKLWPASHGNMSTYGVMQSYPNVGFSAVLRYSLKKPRYEGDNDYAWSVTYISGSTAEPAKFGTIGSPDGNYRLWFGMNKTVYHMDLQRTIQNPIEVSGFNYAASAEHISPWFDADLAVGDKLAARVKYYMETSAITEYIKLYYGTDYDDDTWTLFTNSTFTDGQIDTTGETEFTFASDAGVAFKAIRFKEELFRGSTTTVTPDRRWMRLAYRKLLDVNWGFTVRVDCRKNYRFQTAKSMLNQLKTDMATKTLGKFQYRDGNGTETYNVGIDNIKAAEIGGTRVAGIVDLTLVAP